MNSAPSPAVILALNVLTLGNPNVVARKTPLLNFAQSDSSTSEANGGRRFKDVLQDRGGVRDRDQMKVRRDDGKRADAGTADAKKVSQDRDSTVDEDRRPMADHNHDAEQPNAESRASAQQQSAQDDKQAVRDVTADDVTTEADDENPAQAVVELPRGEELRAIVTDSVTAGVEVSARVGGNGGKELPQVKELSPDGDASRQSGVVVGAELSGELAGPTTEMPSAAGGDSRQLMSVPETTSLDSSNSLTTAGLQHFAGTVASSTGTAATSETAGASTAAGGDPTKAGALTPLTELTANADTDAAEQAAATGTSVAATVRTSSAQQVDGVSSLNQAVLSRQLDASANGQSANYSASANAAVTVNETAQLLKETRGDINIIPPPVLSAEASATAKETAEAKTPRSQIAASAVDAKWAQSLSQLQNSSLGARTVTMQTQVPFNGNSNGQWFNAVAERVMWLASKNIQAAELHLDPPELGPVQVRVAVNHDQASVNFISHHVSVREALDLNVQRLRDMFAHEGMNLVNVDVSDRSLQQQNRDQQQSSSANGTGSTISQGDADNALAPTAAIKITHLVDHYI